MGAPDGDVVACPQYMRRAGEWFLRQNVFYLLSAFLMLLGCYLISLPHLLTPRPDFAELLVLLGVINIYEGLVILACGFILRRMPASREAALLLLVEILFLFDMTFTAGSCLTRDLKLGLAVAAAGFVLALLKVYALEKGARHPLFSGLKRFLVPALLLLYSFQGALVLYSPELPALRALCAFAVWLTFAALALLLPSYSPDAAAPAAPWWTTPSFRRVVGGLSLGLLALQVVAQSWVHRAALEFSFVLPALCALVAAAPFCVSLPWARQHAARRAMLLVLLCVAGLLAGSDQLWRLGPGKIPIALSPLRVDLFFAALVSGIMFWRERSQWHAHALCALCAAGIIGTDSEALRQFWLRPSDLQFAACVAIGLGWFAFRPSRWRAAVVFLAELWLLLRFQQSPSPSWQLLRWGLLGLLLLYAAPARPRLWSCVLHAAVFMCGAWSCQPLDTTALLYFYAVAAAWSMLAVRGTRVYVPLLLAYLAVADARLLAREVPHASIGWGWPVVVMAFAVFGLAFWITRRNLALHASPEP